MATQDRCAMLGKLLVVKVSVVCAALLFGCATPDLRPFAEATKTLDTTVASGGDLAITSITLERQSHPPTSVSTSDRDEQAGELRKSWNERRKTMEAVLVYSASLAAINEASANRKENATELVGSVEQLVKNVPGLSLGASGAGDLLVFGLQTVVEVKAWNDMKRAIGAADPAIQLVGKSLSMDFAKLSLLFESVYREQIIQIRNDLRSVERFHDEVQKSIGAERAKAKNGSLPVAAGAELIRLRNVMATVEPELSGLQKEKSDMQARLQEGTEFFAAANRAVKAWANAHSDLVKALEQNRAPNLVVLAARAEELKGIVDRLKR